MHTLPVMLAEDYSGLYTILSIICLTPVVGAVFGIAMARRWPTLALVLGVLGILVGAFLLLLLGLPQDGALPVFWIGSGLPLVAGCICFARGIQCRK